MVPSLFSTRFETFAPGLAKCGVLVAFSASPRNCTRQRSLTANSRKIPASRLNAPGPRTTSKAAVPKVAVVTGANARGSKYDWFGPAPPRIATLLFTRFARCMLPGAFKDVPDAVTLNCVPEYVAISPFNCQPPASFELKPEVAQRLPLPNGSSAMNDALKLCVRSYGITVRFSLK